MDLSELHKSEYVTTHRPIAHKISPQVKPAIRAAPVTYTPQLEQATAYIAAWIKELRNDKSLVVKAASQAQKAADYITAA